LRIGVLIASNLVVYVESLRDLEGMTDLGVRVQKGGDDAALIPIYFPALTIVGPDLDLSPKPGEDLEN
jgi:hypothetical protein